MLPSVLAEEKQKSGLKRETQIFSFFKLLSFKLINLELNFKKNDGKLFLNIIILLVMVLNIKIVCIKILFACFRHCPYKDLTVKK